MASLVVQAGILLLLLWTVAGAPAKRAADLADYNAMRSRMNGLTALQLRAVAGESLGARRKRDSRPRHLPRDYQGKMCRLLCRLNKCPPSCGSISSWM